MAIRDGERPATTGTWPAAASGAAIPAPHAVQTRAGSRRQARREIGRWLFWLATGLIVIWSVGPFVWVAITSFKLDRDLATLPPILPPQPTFQHYVNLFAGRPFYRYIINSAIVSVATTIVCLLLGTLGGYALARLQFPGRMPILLGILAVSMFPQISVVAAIYVTLQRFGLLNTYAGLVIPYNTFALPLAIWILTSFFRGIPAELEQASQTDGSTRLGALFRIILPLSAPGLFTTAILVFIAAWNEFLFALTYTSSIDHQTIPVGIALLPAMYAIPWGDIAAASVVVTAPLIVLVLLFQRWIVQGLTAGAMKG
ncbi:MAG TPA: carbohydrate ABC transporter permease [Thermomicrobiales bacterium]|jgi:ABC-type glycerol-3-phosphate transport system permease component|nr:carbohydrate ABC transporter permease [Thermomicrobiales bacterium]